MADKLNVYECIAAVSAEIALTGISKDRKNEQQHYKFRGIDDVYNALAPILAKHKLVILPRILSREVIERQTKSGGTLFYVTVEAEFDFVSAHDGSKTTVRTYGEAMDSADKATNKAMSAAYKYAAFQTFCIPTEGDNDADATTPPEIVAKQPDGFDKWLEELADVAVEGTPRLQKMWEGSKKDYRAHLTATNAAAWKRLKAVAEQADKASTEAAS